MINGRNLSYVLLFLVWLLFLFMPLSIIAEDGVLESIRKETKDSELNKSPPKSNNPRNHNSYDDDSESFFGEIFGPIIAYILISPYYVPHHFWDEGFSEWLYFRPYPYKNKELGYLTAFEGEGVKPWAIDISSEYKIYFDSVYGYGLNLNIRTNFRVELQADYNYLEEIRDNGSTDSLALGNVNLLFRFAQNQYLLMRSGVGLNILNDNEDAYGFNFTYSADVYPIKPMFFSARIDLGRLGDATYTRFRATVGIIYKQYELNTGFESYNIGDTSLQGLTLGFKYYF